MTTIENLKQRKEAILADNNKLRQHDLAQQLGISELELLTLTPSEQVVQLAGDPKELLQQINRMGYVMALTRNEACVHERKGVYDNLQFYGGPANMGVAVNPDIDLRFFMNKWKYMLAVVMDRGKMELLYSFQFFNASGEAVHKIFSTDKSDIEVYQQLVAEYRAEDQSPLFPLPELPAPTPPVIIPDDEVDTVAFQEEWLQLKDTHDFFGLLKKYQLNRMQALRLAPSGHSQQVAINDLKEVLGYCVKKEVPIMCFVHSKGCIQIHSGAINHLKELGNWYNILDRTFNLHLNLDLVKSVWIVRKPTDDGVVTSLELFDENNELIVYFFGARKPGKPELTEWRKAVSSLHQEEVGQG